jgi:hypothetical protein
MKNAVGLLLLLLVGTCRPVGATSTYVLEFQSRSPVALLRARLRIKQVSFAPGGTVGAPGTEAYPSGYSYYIACLCGHPKWAVPRQHVGVTESLRFGDFQEQRMRVYAHVM